MFVVWMQFEVNWVFKCQILLGIYVQSSKLNVQQYISKGSLISLSLAQRWCIDYPVRTSNQILFKIPIDWTFSIYFHWSVYTLLIESYQFSICYSRTRGIIIILDIGLYPNSKRLETLCLFMNCMDGSKDELWKFESQIVSPVDNCAKYMWGLLK